jgi:polyphosphate glucokinase
MTTNVLFIDVGGTHVDVLATGQTNRTFASGPNLRPKRMVSEVRNRVADWNNDAIFIGYPGPVLRNRPVSEPWNLGKSWKDFNFEAAFKRPIKVVNDAATQALGRVCLAAVRQEQALVLADRAAAKKP